MKILYLVPHVPNPTKARSWYHLRGLREAGHTVTVATVMRNAADQKHIENLRTLGFQALVAPLDRMQALGNIVESWRHGLPLQARYAWSPGLMQAIEKHLATAPSDVIHVEHLRMACYGLRLQERWPVGWDAVDSLSDLFAQTAAHSVNPIWRVIARLEAKRLYAYERWLTSQFPLTLLISDHDQGLFQHDNPHADRIRVASPGLPIQSLEKHTRTDNTLILTGALSYHPNIASVKFLVKQILPRVLHEKTTTRLQIVGANPPAWIKNLKGDSIEVTGVVPSLFDYLSRATIALAPITYSAGIQNKVLEAFLTATPLVATSIALHGFDVQDRIQAMIADTPEQFVNAILELLANPALRESIGVAGRRYVEQHHDLRQTTAALVALYESVRK